MHDNWQFAVTLGAIIVGIFFNNAKLDELRKELGGVRSELDGKLGNLRTEIHSDINLLTGKFIELIDRLAKIETKLESK